jgi:YD repeat-containing protein
VYLFADLQNLVTTAVQISYETVPDPTKIQKRLVEDVRILYLKDDLSGPLPPGQSGSLGLVYETYKLAFTSNLAEQVFITGNSNPNKPADVASSNTLLAGEGGYVNNEGANWWVPSGQIMYSPVPVNPPDPFVQDATFAVANFFSPQAHRDPFGQLTRVSYDSYDFLLAQTQDALGNTVKAQNDYRVLQPRELMDPNGNYTEAAFDALGMLVGTAVKGKLTAAGDSESGDSFTTFTTDVARPDIDGLVNNPNPANLAPDLLGTATSRVIYDLERFWATQTADPTEPTKWEPVFAATIVRETHVSDLEAGQESKVQVSFSFSDGLGREIQKKIPAKPGPLDLNDPQSPNVNPRWIGSGWLKAQEIKTLYIKPGSPWENGHIESFHDKLRDECLNRELFGNLHEARVILESWRVEYNERRPHSALGRGTPSEYAKNRTNRFDGGCAPQPPRRSPRQPFGGN